MKTIPLPPISELSKAFVYDAKSGVLKWRVWRPHLYGKDCVAGSVSSGGYVRVNFRGRFLAVHRVVWALVTGSDPHPFEVDHRNNKRTDNRFSNLRLASKSSNQHNRLTNSSTLSGVKGVGWYSKYACWRARIMIDKKQILVGYFNSIEAASRSLRSKRRELHKEFTNHG